VGPTPIGIQRQGLGLIIALLLASRVPEALTEVEWHQIIFLECACLLACGKRDETGGSDCAHHGGKTKTKTNNPTTNFFFVVNMNKKQMQNKLGKFIYFCKSF